MLNITALPSLSDNYIWLVGRAGDDRVAVVDPGEAGPVQQYIAEQGLRIGAYLVTHHHGDHIGGLDALLAEYPAPVHGPRAEADRIGQITHALAGDDQFTLDFLDTTFRVIDVPGHTLGHIALFTGEELFAGDTLFRGGCGRVFEGDAQQMQTSLATLRDLPEATRVYSGHEYTQKNLAFAHAVEPDNPAIASARRVVDDLRAAGQPSLPSTMGEEHQTNPFLRWDQEDVIAAAQQRAGGTTLDGPAAIFATLREWKNAF